MRIIIGVFALAALVTGCTKLPFLYRPDIQQGNLISQEAVAQLKPGMPADQVRYLMGTPVLINVFDSSRWDYIYTYQPGKGDLRSKQVVVHFADNVVESVEQK